MANRPVPLKAFTLLADWLLAGHFMPPDLRTLCLHGKPRRSGIVCRAAVEKVASGRVHIAVNRSSAWRTPVTLTVLLEKAGQQPEALCFSSLSKVSICKGFQQLCGDEPSKAGSQTSLGFHPDHQKPTKGIMAGEQFGAGWRTSRGRCDQNIQRLRFAPATALRFPFPKVRYTRFSARMALANPPW